MPRCPHCDQVLLTEATPCPHCKPRGIGMNLNGFFADFFSHPLRAEQAQLLNRLEEIAPALMRWKRLPDPKGPKPDVHPRHREEVDRIHARAREIAAELAREKDEQKKEPPQPPKLRP